MDDFKCVFDYNSGGCEVSFSLSTVAEKWSEMVS